MFAIAVTYGIGNLHQHIMTQMQVILCETDSHRKLNARVGLDVFPRRPRRFAAEFLMYSMVPGSWKAYGTDGKQCKGTKNGTPHIANLECC